MNQLPPVPEGETKPMADKGVLAGSKAGYLHNVLVYYGRETQLIQNDLPHTVKSCAHTDGGTGTYGARFVCRQILYQSSVGIRVR